MTPWLIWIIFATIMAVVEMMSGTFYLLILAGGALAGGAVAGLGLSTSVQILCATLVTLAGWVLLYKFGPQLARAEAHKSADVNPDIGATVRLSELNVAGEQRVMYRGASWAARLDGATPELNRDYVIVSVEGAKLILAPKTTP